jgi:hypothetical protein
VAPARRARPPWTRGALSALDPPSPGGPEPARTIRIVCWDDGLIGACGFDPRSRYVERFWLPILGPSATWLLRQLADGLERSPAGLDLDVEEASARLGLGRAGGRQSPFRRAVGRCVRFGFARASGASYVAVRRVVSALPERHVLRLHPTLRLEHRRWEADPASWACAELRFSVRSAAGELLAAGLDPLHAEAALSERGVHPALAYASSRPARVPPAPALPPHPGS